MTETENSTNTNETKLGSLGSFFKWAIETSLQPAVLLILGLLVNRSLQERKDAAQIENTEASTQLAQVNLKAMSVGALEIDGQVSRSGEWNYQWNPDAPRVERVTFSLNLTNAGHAPVDVESIRVDVRKGTLPEEWHDRLIWHAQESDIIHANRAPAPPLSPEIIQKVNAIEAAGGSASLEPDVFALDTSSIWSDPISTFAFAPTENVSARVHQDQTRHISRDFLIVEGSRPEMLRFDVYITTTGGSSEVRRWSTWIGIGPTLRETPFQVYGIHDCIPLDQPVQVDVMQLHEVGATEVEAPSP